MKKMTAGPIGCKVESKIHGYFGEFEACQGLGWICGQIFLNGRIVSLSELQARLGGCQSSADLTGLLRSLDGFFSFFIRAETKVYIAADRARSRPLFYRHDNARFVVSDSLAWVCRRFPDLTIDSTADLQLQKFGYTIGPRTLAHDVSQVQAGELILSSAQGFSRIFYHDYLPQHSDLGYAAMDQVAVPSVEAALLQSLEPLCSSRHDQFVVPLSSGCDSRALLSALCALGKREQVLAFTYGRESSHNIKVAERVTNALGVDWLPIEYSRETWQTVLSRDWFAEYLKLGFSGVSVPSIQAIPAMDRLSSSGIINKAAVFLPAHSGFFPGGRLPNSVSATMAVVEADGLAQYLFTRLGNFRSQEATFERLAISLNERLFELESVIPRHWGAERFTIALIEMMDLLERQAKFIANSNRYYDFFGFDWSMPFWGKNFVDFWSMRSFSERLGKRAWREATRVLEERLRINKSELPSFALNSRSDRFGGYAQRATEYVCDQNRLFDLVDFRDWVAYRFGRSSRDGSPLGGILSKVRLAADRESLQLGEGMFSHPNLRSRTRTPVELCYNLNS
jgi:asparagine synthase (glutamine-hydrolysing)